MGLSSFLSQVVEGATSSGATVQDWKHASNVFASGNMLRSPKHKGLFHVNFIFNDWTNKATGAAAQPGIPPSSAVEANFNTVYNTKHKSDILSVLTKSIDLPKFELQYSTHNQYNKTTHTYKKMKYDPITVTFHDDMSDYVWGLWAFYYSWYFADGTKGYIGDPHNNSHTSNKVAESVRNFFTNAATSIYGFLGVNKGLNSASTAAGAAAIRPGVEWELASRYASLLFTNTGNGFTDTPPPNWTQAWGMNGSVYHTSGGSAHAQHLLKAIEIYPMGNKKASVLVIHNPKIISWDHDTWDYSAQGTATCKMSLAYEGVSYIDQVSAASVLNNVSFYDKHPSPLMSGSPTNLLGEGGLIDRGTGVIGNLLNGNISVGTLINAVGVAKAIGNKQLINNAGSELKSAVNSSVTAATTFSNLNSSFPGPVANAPVC